MLTTFSLPCFQKHSQQGQKILFYFLLIIIIFEFFFKNDTKLVYENRKEDFHYISN